MVLTAENYHSQEANIEYMSASQVKAFQKCEAAALAELTGEYVREATGALLVGSYVDAHFSNQLDLFKAKHPEIFTRQGDLKAEYRNAEEIISRIERDPFMMKYLAGEKQVIKTAILFDHPFKIMVDSYHPGKAIVDLKVMRDFASVYSPEQGRQTFIEAWGYDLQGAIYQAVEGNRLPFFIAAATKERVPDIAVIAVPQETLDAALMIVEHMVDNIAAIKDGVVEPTRCEKCDYCKSTKVLAAVTDMADLDGAA